MVTKKELKIYENNVKELSEKFKGEENVICIKDIETNEWIGFLNFVKSYTLSVYYLADFYSNSDNTGIRTRIFLNRVIIQVDEVF
jgi:hypothetical protein